MVSAARTRILLFARTTARSVETAFVVAQKMPLAVQTTVLHVAMDSVMAMRIAIRASKIVALAIPVAMGCVNAIAGKMGRIVMMIVTAATVSVPMTKKVTVQQIAHLFAGTVPVRRTKPVNAVHMTAVAVLYAVMESVIRVVVRARTRALQIARDSS